VPVIRAGQLRGYRPDPPGDDEPADIRAMLGRTGATVATIREEVVLEERTDISDQGDSNSCVWNAWADAMELLMPADDVRQVSRLTGYWCSRAQHGEECVDEGTYIRVAGDVSRDVGVCLERLWPFKLENVNVRPPLEALQQCWDNRIDGHYTLRVTGITESARRRSKKDQLKALLMNGFPIVGAFALGQDFDEIDGRDVAHGPPNGRSVQGWHAMVIVGFRELSDGDIHWRLRNSWGGRWGRSGYCHVTSSYVLDSSFCNDIRVPTRAPTFG
jgi:hypothetical protein